MELWEILVPTKRNNGRPFTTRHHKEWDKRVRKLSSGLTIYTPAKGQWVDLDGDLFEERMIPVRIACNSRTIQKIMDITAQHYDQLAIMAYCVSDNVVIKRYDPPTEKVPVTDGDPEHIRIAKFWAARMGMYSTLWITFIKDNLYLEERHFSGPEVDWTVRHHLDNLQQAYDILDAGICRDWMDCLPERDSANAAA